MNIYDFQYSYCEYVCMGVECMSMSECMCMDMQKHI